VKLQVNAPERVVLPQKEKPVGYAFRALKETETNCPNREGNICSTFMDGKSDHKPLESDMCKLLAVATRGMTSQLHICQENNFLLQTPTKTNK